MRENNHDNRRKARVGAATPRNNTAPEAGTAEQRRMIREGLRLLAGMISRVHPRRQHPVPHRSRHRTRGLAAEPLPEPAAPPASTMSGIPSALDVTHRLIPGVLGHPTIIGFAASRPEPALNPHCSLETYSRGAIAPCFSFETTGLIGPHEYSICCTPPRQ